MKNKSTKRRGGWALAISLLMAFLLAAIAGVCLNITSTNRKVTDASFTFHAMQPIAEGGVDSAMKVIDRYVHLNTGAGTGPISGANHEGSFTGNPGDGWSQIASITGLVIHPGTLAFAKNFGEKDLGDGRRAILKVIVANVPTAANPTALPYVISDVALNSTTGSPSKYSRQFLAIMRPENSTGSGLIALNSLSFSGGNVIINGYDSLKGAPASTNISDQVTVGSPLTTLDIASVSIYGFVSVAPGGAGISFKKGAHVWDALSALTDPMYITAGVDPTNLSQTFDKSISDYPPDGIQEILKRAGVTSLPAKTTANTITISKSGAITMGGKTITGLTSGIYYMDTPLTLTGKSGSTLKINGSVSLIMGSDATGKPLLAGGPELKISGQGGFIVESTSPTKSSLNLYTSGNVDITGNGIMSGTSTTPTQPTPEMIYLSGLGAPLAKGATPTQSIKVAGNGQFSGVIYAPAAALELRGGGSSGTLTGSIVAWNVSATGNANFHYDINLTEAYTPDFKMGYMAELRGDKKISLSSIP